MMKKSLSTPGYILEMSDPMDGVRGSVGAMIGGRYCGLTERFKISIVAQRISSAGTVASLIFSHSRSSEFNSTRLGKIMLLSGKGVTERPDIC